MTVTTPSSFPVVNETYLEFSLVHCEACDGDSEVLSDPYLLILREWQRMCWPAFALILSATANRSKSARMETPWSLWATSAGVWSALQEVFFLKWTLKSSSLHFSLCPLQLERKRQLYSKSGRKKVLDYNKWGNLVAKMLNFHATVQISRFYSLEEGNPSSPNRDRWGSSHLSELQLKAALKMRERVLCQHMLSACSQLYLYIWVQENSLLSEARWVSPAQFCGDEWIPQESFTATEHIKSGTWINWLG